MEKKQKFKINNFDDLNSNNISDYSNNIDLKANN